MRGGRSSPAAWGDGRLGGYVEGGETAACSTGALTDEGTSIWELAATMGGGGVLKSCVGPGGGKVCTSGGEGSCGKAGGRDWGRG